MHKRLTGTALQLGASGAAVIRVEQISFRPEFRAACEQNTCGQYARCWMCPPDVGEVDDLITQAKRYEYALIFQSVGQLEDSFDIEGMLEAGKKHNELTLAIDREIAALYGDFLRLGAGGCRVCEVCAKADNLPCRSPRRATASLEAYGVAVSELAEACGLKYMGSQNTVTYFGGFLFGRVEAEDLG
ncbi:MAG: DUF2284 domain-containing protein [Oscillospiraceae bacterium]|nr:DUF2284 domain-containing protein [Oscillospiraceae bacterium]